MDDVRAEGRLAPNPTKVSRDIYFSIAPKDMDVEPLKKGTFYRCCGDYAESDIYYLEVCMLNEVCRNQNDLSSSASAGARDCRPPSASVERDLTHM